MTATDGDAGVGAGDADGGADVRVPTPQGTLFARRWPGAADRVPIVLIHDSLGSVGLWRGLPAALAHATGRAVVAYDRLGFGRSDPHPGRLGWDFVAAEAGGGLAAIRAALGIGRFVAIGHSVGGGMALFAAAAYPDDCTAVVTISAQADNDDRVRVGLRAARAEFACPGQVERLARHHGDKAPWVVDSWLGTWLAPEFADFTAAPARRALRCPVLAIHGAADEYGTPDHAARIAGPDGALDVIADAGHFPHRTHAAQVVRRIAAFLAPLP